ncbi:hypothetical protein NOM07_08505 [Proteus terrae]|uniref:hypothetical protein n=1 Tax=Proteus terrae TaxID=1574161 RepID=UPI001EF55E66|nr:hypothetical protein [Proteus terrae]MCS6713382.1 hypothetical protein [Proteus terrae]MCS6732402.1 hypothetical protein [Proteus terrae]
MASLGFLSPLSAVILGWWTLLGQQLTSLQILGMIVILLSIWANQQSEKRERAKLQSLS